MSLASGETFGGFTIVRLLGLGSIAEVYLAEHPTKPRQYALKVLSAEISADAEFRERFSTEAHRIVRLHHRNIVSVHRREQHEGQLWTLMDYVDGTDIGSRLRQRHPAGMPTRRVLIVVNAVAAALDYAHHRGLLHRDVKPSNILLTAPDAGKSRILLSDFGLARRGTTGYAAPEQQRGEPLDKAADQYALAATAFHLLTGSPPSRTSGPEASVDDRLTEAQAAVLARAMSNYRNDRFDSCAQFANALASAVDEPREPTTAPIQTVPVPARQQPPRAASHRLAAKRQPRRSRLIVIVLAAVFALTFVVGGIFVGTQLAGNRHQSSTAAQPTHPPTGARTGTVPAMPSPPGCGDLDAIVRSMTTRDKLAQLLMVGVAGAADARAVVANQHVGGVFIGSWTDLSMLTNGSLADIVGSAGPLPLAVSVDEEGGRVSRLSSLIGEMPSARTLAQSRTSDEVYREALDRGRKMSAYGITIDFAPVVDVTDAPANSVIGDRSFSANPDVVTQYAGAYARGLREAGVLPVLKHFPGHGRASGDSHLTGVVTPALDDLQTKDLVPYRTLVAQGPVGVMIGHLEVPGLTGGEPASLSQAAVGLLRGGTDYGGPPYNGPVFTDDLSSMRAISDRYGVVEAVLHALQAGADTALWVTTTEVPAVLDRLEGAVANGELDPKNVNRSVSRMAMAKTAFGRCGR